MRSLARAPNGIWTVSPIPTLAVRRLRHRSPPQCLYARPIAPYSSFLSNYVLDVVLPPLARLAAPPPAAGSLVATVISARAGVILAARPVSAVLAGRAVFALDDYFVIVAMVAVDKEGKELIGRVSKVLRDM